MKSRETSTRPLAVMILCIPFPPFLYALYCHRIDDLIRAYCYVLMHFAIKDCWQVWVYPQDNIDEQLLHL